MSEILRPTEAQQAAAYDQIAAIARHHALILSAAGGVITIVHPRTQREEGIFERIQWLHGWGKHPAKLEHERAIAEAGAVPDMDKAQAHYQALAREIAERTGEEVLPEHQQ
ncbi:hypothetical protein [Achromobacter aloeverae]